jgi:hypothetical protein
MNKVAIIHFLEKYKKICAILNLSDDVHSFDEIISFVEANRISIDSEKSHTKLNNENDFYKITSTASTDGIDLSEYNINQEIIINKMNILNYWIKLDTDKKEKFNSLELNFIMYLLTNKNNNYLKKEKKKIIMDIDMTVRNKRTSNSYNNITV